MSDTHKLTEQRTPLSPRIQREVNKIARERNLQGAKIPDTHKPAVLVDAEFLIGLVDNDARKLVEGLVPIGTYTGWLNSEIPYYAERIGDTAQGKMRQVLVLGIGGFHWINLTPTRRA